MTTDVAFIGLGIMGRPMAANLLAAGCPLTVYARRAETAESLVRAGATLASSPGEAAAAAEVTITMVADTADVESVILDRDGIGETARPGSVVMDMSTISPAATRRLAQRLAQRQVTMVDAPVSGGEQGAKDGALSIMVGGPDEAVDRVRPLLEIMGGNIVHVGGHGAGQVAKACNQLLVAQTIEAVAEALLMAERSGVDPGRVREALLGGFAYSRILENHGARMLSGDYTPGFKARLHQKDLRIVMAMADELGLALPGAALATQLVNALVGNGLGEQDSSSLFSILDRLNGGDNEQRR